VTIVDSSVWNDYFRGCGSRQTDLLHHLLGTEAVGIGDLILVEVLQGFSSDADFARARDALTSLTIFEMLGQEASIRCATNYRRLRQRGVTVRKTADLSIASFCIEHAHTLLYADRDFEPFVEHLGLRASIRVG
jgi:predicted nucleic acid-binding protein